jgi:hypothetical protein
MKRRFFQLRLAHEPKNLLVFLVAFAVCSTAATATLNAQAPRDAMPQLVDYRMKVGGCDPGGTHRCRCKSGASSQCGRDVCCPTMEEVTEEVPCWKVTCEKVCVPAVRMPWEKGASKLTLFSWLSPRKHGCSCGACTECVGCRDCCSTSGPCTCCSSKCGAVLCVSVLAPDSFEVTKCKCKWAIKRLPAVCHAECLDCGEGVMPMPETEPEGELELPPLPQS